MSMDETTNTYSELLHYLGHGCALFDPDPCGDYDRVRPGDVGYIRTGKFHRAFNVFFPKDDSINELGVPEGHQPLVFNGRHISTSTALSPGAMHSENVKVRGLVINMSLCAR